MARTINRTHLAILIPNKFGFRAPLYRVSSPLIQDVFFFSPPFQDLWKATVTLLWAFGTSRPDFCQQRTGSIYLRTTCKNNYAFADFHSCFHANPTLDILIIFCDIKLSSVFKLTLILAKTPWSWGRMDDILSEGREIESRRQLVFSRP